jgi:predicted Zn-ribbon and HTH transcriptional regulator
MAFIPHPTDHSDKFFLYPRRRGKGFVAPPPTVAMESTTRERIAAALRESPATASDLSARVGTSRSAVYDHLQHVARSLRGDDGDERVLVSPPTCRDCGFDGFDDPINHPSTCPECRSEDVAEPAFRID